MKKSIVALCGIALCAAAFAEEPATPAAPAQAPLAERGPRASRPNRPMPTMLLINEKTTAEDIANYKAEIAKKIDAAFAAYAEKTGEEKKPVGLMFMVNERAMRPMGAGQGPRAHRRRPEQAPKAPSAN